MQTAVNSSCPPETNKQYIYIHTYMSINHMYIKKAVAPVFLRVLSRFVQLRCSGHKTAGGGKLHFKFELLFLFFSFFVLSEGSMGPSA